MRPAARRREFSVEITLKSFSILLLSLIVGVGLFFWWQYMTRPIGRTTVLLGTNPLLIWSVDEGGNYPVLIELPKDLVIEAVGGYGTYSLGAIWKLGNIEKKSGQLLSQSLEQALGVPLAYYLGALELPEASSGDAWKQFREIFSWRSFFRGGKFYIKNIPIGLFVRLYWQQRFIKADDVKRINIGQSIALVPEMLPDGSVVNIIDPQRMDVLLGQTLEDPVVRRERLTVGVYNTTGTPSVAGRVARILGSLGMLVVAVGNSPQTEAGNCVLAGGREALSSQTARLIKSILECDIRNESVERVDLRVNMGAAYAGRF